MNEDTRNEILRLTSAAAAHREDLLISAHKKIRLKKISGILSGVLALVSAGAITSAVVSTVGETAMQTWAAISAAISGTVSLVTAAYFADDEIANMLMGSSRYLALRDNVYRLVIQSKFSEEARIEALAELYAEYCRLDESYSRFFSVDKSRRFDSKPRELTNQDRRIQTAEQNEIARALKKIKEINPGSGD